MRKKTRSLGYRMFLSIAMVLLAFILAFVAVNVMTTFGTMRKELSSSMEQLAINVIQQLDDDIRQLSLLTERIVFSGQLRESIVNQLPHNDGVERYRELSRLNELMYAICGAKLTFFHANIITDGGYQYAFGADYRYTQLENAPQQYDWFNRAIERDGKVHIVPLHPRDVGGKPVPVISVCRAFGPVLGLPVSAVVEVQRDYDKLAAMIERAA